MGKKGEITGGTEQAWRTKCVRQNNMSEDREGLVTLLKALVGHPVRSCKITEHLAGVFVPMLLYESDT